MKKEEVNRASRCWFILNKDLESGLCRKEEFKDCLEYWCYRQKEYKPVIWVSKSFRARMQEKQPTYLYAIIICEKGSNHITKKGEKGMMIAGIRIIGDSVNEYLRKTGRHTDEINR